MLFQGDAVEADEAYALRFLRAAAEKALGPGFHTWGYPNSWMVYKGKSYENDLKWMMTGESPYLRKPPDGFMVDRTS